MTRKRKEVIDLSDVEVFDIKEVTARYPLAIFLKCRCSSINPLGILRADPTRVTEVITEAFTWDREGQTWVPRNEEYPRTIPMLRLSGYQVEFVKTLDNREDRLMVFCFSKDK